MFPLRWNFPFRKKDGSMVNLEDAMGGGGGGSDLPPHSVADAGKVLGVTDQGTLAWVTVSAGGTRYAAQITNANIELPTSSGEEVTT